MELLLDDILGERNILLPSVKFIFNRNLVSIAAQTEDANGKLSWKISNLTRKLLIELATKESLLQKNEVAQQKAFLTPKASLGEPMRSLMLKKMLAPEQFTEEDKRLLDHLFEEVIKAHKGYKY
jgi:hypothetical protein